MLSAFFYRCGELFPDFVIVYPIILHLIFVVEYYLVLFSEMTGIFHSLCRRIPSIQVTI